LSWHQFFFEHLIGDLEYHPKRALTYLALGAAGASIWIFGPVEARTSPASLVCGAGGVVLLLKGILLLRKTSERMPISELSLGLSPAEMARSVSVPIPPKALPTVSVLAAQLIQDFGAGALLLVFVLHFATRVNENSRLPVFQVFVIGGLLFGAGWLIRYLNRE
jgi:hypothetical protein